MKLSRKGFIFGVLILSAVIVGGYIGQHTSDSLLSYTVSLGLNHDAPLQLDLIVLSISVGLTLNISIAQIISVMLAIIIFTVFSKFFD